jgi:hypothetical protein
LIERLAGGKRAGEKTGVESDLSEDKGLDLTVMQMPEICLFVR